MCCYVLLHVAMYCYICMAMYGYVWVCMAMYGYVCMAMYSYVCTPKQKYADPLTDRYQYWKNLAALFEIAYNCSVSGKSMHRLPGCQHIYALSRKPEHSCTFFITNSS